MLIEKFNNLETLPWRQPKNNFQIKSNKVVCEKCNRVGHSTDQCWGKCTVCKKFGHKANKCFLKGKEEAAKLALKDKKREKKKKKKIKYCGKES